MTIFLLLLALLGHALLWIGVVNRIHAMAVPYKFGHLCSAFGFACLVAVPLAFAYWFALAGIGAASGSVSWQQFPLATQLYLEVCWFSLVVGIGSWTWRGMLRRPPKILRSHHIRSIHLGRIESEDDRHATTPSKLAHHFVAHLPANDILKLDVTQRAVDVPRLAPALDALSIIHLSDLHFTGWVDKSYFQEVVRRCNELEPDLVAISGDLIDRASCIEWIPDTLGKLAARHGVYYVLGNHDIRLDTDRLRKTLNQSGLIDLGGRWIQIDVRGEPVVLAGNELPWIAPAADLRTSPPRTSDGRPLRIVLSHSPDQIGWAQGQDADLMLAGHTHGGQICLPLFGAVFSASRLGVNYVSGIFYAPPTIMHITRGVSAELPLRLNCPPELSRLVLRSVRQETD